ncbi:hypothetical protein C8R44DRAFT_878876 [Mycena epipterygia]|nr:hypothetical protein C8R44DRAFT_878876 [Mycena epipterygia]
MSDDNEYDEHNESGSDQDDGDVDGMLTALMKQKKKTHFMQEYSVFKYAGQGPPLIPTGLKEKALFEQAASVEFANFLPAVTNVGKESIRKHLHNLPIDEAALAQAMSEFTEKLDVYEVILAKQKFIGGNARLPS